MHQALDRPTSRRGRRAGRSVPKRNENDPGILLTASLPVSGHPSVVVEAVAKHTLEDPPDTDRALRACSHMRQHIPDAPLVAERVRVLLLDMEIGQSIHEIGRFVTNDTPYLHVTVCLALSVRIGSEARSLKSNWVSATPRADERNSGVRSSIRRWIRRRRASAPSLPRDGRCDDARGSREFAQASRAQR
jgi:hypothetical protein